MDRPRLLALLVLVAVAASCGPPDAPGTAVPEFQLHTLPAWSPVGGLAFGRHVFLQSSQQNEMGIGHELVHVRQQAQGALRFWATYVLSPRWRLRWEAEAYAVQARAGCPIDGDHGLAAYLSGPAYLWISTRDESERRIREYL